MPPVSENEPAAQAQNFGAKQNVWGCWPVGLCAAATRHQSICPFVRFAKRRRPSIPDGRLHGVDGGKPNSVVGRSFLSRRLRDASRLRGMRLIPGSCLRSRGGESGGSCFLFCLAPHGVFRAPALARRAVGSYPAFSPLPCVPCGPPGGLIFCDTFRHARLAPRVPAHSTRHAA